MMQWSKSIRKTRIFFFVVKENDRKRREAVILNPAPYIYIYIYTLILGSSLYKGGLLLSTVTDSETCSSPELPPQTLQRAATNPHGQTLFFYLHNHF